MLPLRAARLGLPSDRGRCLPAASAGKAGRAARKQPARCVRVGREWSFVLPLPPVAPSLSRKAASQKRHILSSVARMCSGSVPALLGSPGGFRCPCQKGSTRVEGPLGLWRSTGRPRKRGGVWSTATGAGLRSGLPLALCRPMCVPLVAGKTS